MFCPNCGLDEKQPNQFCRACGTNLAPIAHAFARPDSVTASAVNAREEIGRAVAAKIRETQNVYELKQVAENVLPEIEKFLESPEEKRLRRIRIGTIISMIGMGAALAMASVSLVSSKEDYIFLAALGAVTFFIGMAFVLNGYFSTVPKKSIADNSSDADSQRELDATTGGLGLPEPSAESMAFRSVTDNTTVNLGEKLPAGRR